MLVPRLSGAPVTPIRPKKMITGTKFGIIAIRPTRTERNISAITPKMTPVAMARLDTWPLTRSLAVRVIRIRLPVGWACSSGGNWLRGQARDACRPER